jgi:hypothetical protein
LIEIVDSGDRILALLPRIIDVAPVVVADGPPVDALLGVLGDIGDQLVDRPSMSALLNGIAWPLMARLWPAPGLTERASRRPAQPARTTERTASSS